MTDDSKSLVPAAGEFLVYVGDDGATRVHVRLAEGTVWLTQKLIAELYGVSVPTINEHLTGIYETNELDPGATIRKFRIVRTEGNRSVSRLVDHYSLPAIIAVGYRVRSTQGTRFRQWATATLDEYLVKGFVLDDERLKSTAKRRLAPSERGLRCNPYRDAGRARSRFFRADGGCVSPENPKAFNFYTLLPH